MPAIVTQALVPELLSLPPSALGGKASRPLSHPPRASAPQEDTLQLNMEAGGTTGTKGGD